MGSLSLFLFASFWVGFRFSPAPSERLPHLSGMEDNSNRMGLAPLLGAAELARYLGVPVQTIYDWRVNGRGPRAYRVGKHLRFSAADVNAWLEARHERGASETGRG